MRARLPQNTTPNINLLDSIRYLAPAWIGAISAEQDVICRVLGDCVYGAPIDSEVKLLDSLLSFLRMSKSSLTVRYDQAFDAELSDAQRLSKAEAELDDLTVIPLLQQMGRSYAFQNVRLEHFFPRQPHD